MYEFWKITPGGNPTILLRAEDFPRNMRAQAAGAVMSDQHIGAEQVGYVRLSGRPRLDMMGGEFCLNATRSFAVLLAQEGLLAGNGHEYSGSVEVSGVPGDVAVHVRLEPDQLPFAEACLHFASLPVPETLPEQGRLLRIPGIIHIVQEGSVPSQDKLPLFCERQRKTYGVAAEEAVGHLWLSGLKKDGDNAEAELYPVVWVRDTATLCRESACGSGTLACALALHHSLHVTRCAIRQPSGFQLSVRMEHRPEGWDVWVGGPVRMTAHGRTDLTGLLPSGHTL